MVSSLMMKGYRFNLKDIYERKTIRSLVESLKQNKEESNKAELTIQFDINNTKPRIFIVHPAFGRVDCYQNMAKRLSDHYSLCAIQAPWTVQNDCSFDSLSILAKAYTDDVLKVQNTGPFKVGGWSAGGWIASLICQELVSRGHEVDYLFVIDSDLENRTKSNDTTLSALTELAHGYLNEIDAEPEVYTSLDIWLTEAQQLADEQLIPAFTHYIEQYSDHQLMTPEIISGLVEYGINLNSSSREFSKVPVRKSRLFIANENQNAAQYQANWRNHFPQGSVAYISGHHHELMDGQSLEEICYAIVDDLTQQLHKQV